MTFGLTFELSNLNGTNGFVLNGVSAGGGAGRVSDAGDINGDGIADLIIGAAFANGNRGESYVVFGRSDAFSSSLELSTLDGTNGFVFTGNTDDIAGFTVSGLGDVNGDNIDDLIIGAPSLDGSNSTDNAGRNYVVFGRSSGFSSRLELSALNGSTGFVINGAEASNYAGRVSDAGDVNGDGINDILIGAPNADPNNPNAGASYVIFGRSSGGFGSSLELSTLNGINGFVINGIGQGDFSGQAVNAAGDINGDGIDDFIIGVPEANANGNNSGAGYVIFGRSSGFGSSLELSSINGTNGLVLNGAGAGDYAGFAVSEAGDINGDGIDDLIIGAPSADATGNAIAQAGEAYVVFGSSTGFGGSSLNLAALNGANGFAILGLGIGDYTGRSVSAAGDVNGDGIDDLVIGAASANPNDLNNAGVSYVVYGSTAGFGSSLNVANLDGSNGSVIRGVSAQDFSGYSVSGAGDINGDGVDDLIIGATDADPNGLNNAGVTYVIFGVANNAPTVSAPVTRTLSEDAAAITVDLRENATDLDGDALTVTALTFVSGDENFLTNQVVVNDNGILSIDPSVYKGLAAGSTRTATFSYVLDDGKGGTATTTATITIEGRDDVYWHFQDQNNGFTATWQLNDQGNDTGGALLFSEGLNSELPLNSDLWVLGGTGDINQDGFSDVIWRERSGDQVAIWTMREQNITNGYFLDAPSPGLDWVLQDAADYDDDNDADIIWRNSKTGENAVWLIENGQNGLGYFIASLPITAGGWDLSGVGDFDGDGRENDLLWRDQAAGQTVIWFMNDAIAGDGSTGKTVDSFITFSDQGIIEPGPTWSISGVGDVNGDGISDIFWRDTGSVGAPGSGSGSNAIWFMESITNPDNSPGVAVASASGFTALGGQWAGVV